MICRCFQDNTRSYVRTCHQNKVEPERIVKIVANIDSNWLQAVLVFTTSNPYIRSRGEGQHM